MDGENIFQQNVKDGVPCKNRRASRSQDYSQQFVILEATVDNDISEEEIANDYDGTLPSALNFIMN
ncbi:hypothetical protein H0H81_001806 [Sphagnurus paluster]|uniref:Uncharacterized protein n=1 Tax=Sphagnurus paluster TaxID=117069 RepID=A0A9P7FMF5_9AGAR|nr:hypothetical protein H0H81_001806 [Sphagnurus paluster]